MLGNLFPKAPTHPEDYAEAPEGNIKESKTQCPGVTGGKQSCSSTLFILISPYT